MVRKEQKDMAESKKMTTAELRVAINFGKNTIAEFESHKEPVPPFLYKRLIELYEQLAENLSLGI